MTLFAYSGVKILVPTFYAMNDTGTPVRLSVITAAARIAINFLLIVPLGFLGLALAAAVASWLNFALLARKFIKRTGVRCGLGELRIYLCIAAASSVMGLVALLVFQGGRRLLPAHGAFGLALYLGITIIVAMIAVMPLLRLFRVKEERELSGMVARLMGGGRP